MPQRTCCVPSCNSTLIEGAVLHSFPNPLKDYEKFSKWVKLAGLISEDNNDIFLNRRICHLHFDKIYHYPKNRLSKLAIPSLYLPVESQDATIDTPVPVVVAELAELYSGPKTSVPQAIGNTTVPMTVDEQQPSTSTHLRTYSGPNKVESQDATVDTPVPVVVAELTELYSGPKTSVPQATSDRTLPMAEDKQEPSNLDGQHTMTKNRNRSVIKSLEFSNQFEIELFKKVAKTQAELKRCKNRNYSLLQRLKVAKKFVCSKAYEFVTKDLSPAAKTFFNMQVKQSAKHAKGHRFTLDEKILALSLYKPSPKAYRLLSQICILPKKTTLNKLMAKVFLLPGPNDIIFENLKKRVEKMPNIHKYCCIIFDEMAIAAHLSFDKHNGKIKGFSDDGSERLKSFADHVLVFMVRGIFKKFKQPVAYSFCTGTTKTENLKRQLTLIVKKVLETGLKVISTTCDQGSTNMAAINSLINDTRINYLRKEVEFKGGFFEIEGNIIYPIYDPPHLMKGIRNNLLTKNLQFEKNGKKLTAKWAHLVALYKRGPGFKGMRLIPKLTAHHVIPYLIPKMKVKYCTQVFSRTISIAMGHSAVIGRIPKESKETAELLMFFDKLFDSVNGNFNKIEKGKVYRAAVSPKSPHHKLWHNSLPVLKSMKFIGGARAGVVPSISSWIKTVQAFQQITKKLHSIGLRSLLLRNFNQDPLENFFGSIRAHGHRNVMPTLPAFEASYKALLVNNMVSPQSIGANCEDDDAYCLQNLNYFFSINIAKPKPQIIEINFEHFNMDLPNVDNLLKSQNPEHIEKCAAAAYCSGWIIQSINKNIENGNCNTCKEDLEGDSKETFSEFITLKRYSNKGPLYYPSKNLLQCLLHIEEISLSILKNKCEYLQIYEYIKLVTTTLITFNFVTCAQHKELVIKLILEKGISLILHDWCKEVSNLLIGKSTVYDESDPIKVLAHQYYIKHKTKNKSSK